MEKFEYQPLPTEKHIRLLRTTSSPDPLQTGESRGQTMFELAHFPLNEAPPYNAVSYTWGSPEMGHELPLTIGSLPITKTLHIALPHLTQHSSCLWIDQVCINQKDVKEKNSQVLLMGEIYSKSHQTIIWLGEDDGTITHLQELSNIILRHEWDTPFGFHLIARIRSDQSAVDDVIVEEVKKLNQNGNGSQYTNAVLSLLDRPWFQRAWVFQECVLSNEKMFLIGPFCFEFRFLVAIVGAVFCANASSRGKTAENPQKDSCCWLGSGGFGALARMVKLSAERDTSSFSELPFHFLGSISVSTQRSNPRDSVYAFSSLIEELRDNLEPDYEKEPWEVFTDAAYTFINGSMSLDALSLCSGIRRQTESLPSWVPEWGRRMPTFCVLGESPIVNFSASRGHKHKPEPLGDKYRLRVRGKRIDGIAKTINYFNLPDDPVILIPRLGHYLPWREICAEIEAYLENKTEPKPYSKSAGDVSAETDCHLSRPLCTRVIRAILADDAIGAIGAPTMSGESIVGIADKLCGSLLTACDVFRRRELLAAVYASMQNLETSEEVRSLLKANGSEKLDIIKELDELDAAMKIEGLGAAMELLTKLSRVVKGSVLVTGDSGKLGLVPNASQRGDCVLIIHGSKAPVILRPASEEDAYYVIGQCYWEDAMYGEAVNWEENEANEFVLI